MPLPPPESPPPITGMIDRLSIQDGDGSNSKPQSSRSRGWRSPAASGTSSSSSSSWSSPLPGLVVKPQSKSSSLPPTATSSSTSLEGDQQGTDGSGSFTSSLSRDQREATRFSMVGRKKDFKCMERVNGNMVNVLQGLELHTRVFSDAEQKKIVDFVYQLQDMGRNRQLKEQTYSEPRKWMRGKGRITMQFGCCYNYATDKNGNPPGILRDEEVDPLPPLLKSMIKRMVSWHVLPPTCVPNSCIINIYEKDDCIPPHIDHHDFVRPFCTVSFLTECNILFGANLRVKGPGEFDGSTAIPLPVGSVLILNGNGADVAKHCVPAVPAKRISITFRKMDDSKLPFRFATDPELMNLRPLAYPSNASRVQQIAGRASVSPLQQQQADVSPVQQIANRSSVSPLQHQGALLHTPPPSSRLQEETSKEIGNRSSGDRKLQLEASSFPPLGSNEFPPLGSSLVNKPMRKPGRSLRQ